MAIGTWIKSLHEDSGIFTSYKVQHEALPHSLLIFSTVFEQKCNPKSIKNEHASWLYSGWHLFSWACHLIVRRNVNLQGEKETDGATLGFCCPVAKLCVASVMRSLIAAQSWNYARLFTFVNAAVCPIRSAHLKKYCCLKRTLKGYR